MPRLTKEEKKKNKEHCKCMPLDVKIQCWFARNKYEISTILGTLLGILAGLTIAMLL